ncbi:Bacteroides conjugation system ATPase, TraG family [Pustulibacterium marinum]|uniref:Bacteroides conjugation system ATPase, TraG family n=1 Tax=Pustulibacterium marinum TaxID=1224947 RepID=A0A1I7HTE6_9FLAO|nr:TraG family conjugative transposon ATPase [Pustulibacterium marinum]SFU63994.1 Bacteroides conjugation system ATPase, TraG family [Pustulibacterium marinum]
MKRLEIHSKFPILDVDRNLVYAANGNLVLGYRVILPEIYALSESDYQQLHGQWFQALKTLPIGTIVHRQDVYQQKGFQFDKDGHTFLQKATQDYFEGREYLAHTSYLFFVRPASGKFPSNRWSNPFVVPKQDRFVGMEGKVLEFQNAVRDAVTFLNNSRQLQVVPMESAELWQWTQTYFNGLYEELDTDIVREGNNLRVGDRFFEALAINNETCFGETVATSMPNEKLSSDKAKFHQGFLEGLGLALNENHVVNQIIYLDDKQYWRKLLEKRITELKKSVNFGTQNKVILEKLQEIMHQINHDESSRIVRGHCNVLYWDSDTSGLERIRGKIKAVLKELDIRPYYPVGEGRMHYFLNSHPCHVTHFSESDAYVVDLKQALCLYMNTSNYRSDNAGIYMNERQYNLPVLKDVWDAKKKRIKARNFAIFAPTGEGKSFLANHILRQLYEQQVRLVIIDLGGSYDKFAKLYPEEHLVLKYEPGKNLGINPFYKEASEVMTAERLEDLTVFIAELLAWKVGAQKAKEVALKKILRLYYHQVTEGHSLESLYQFVEGKGTDLLETLHLSSREFDREYFLHMLSEYVGEGIYSFLFQVEDTQAFTLEDKRLLIFELDEVRDNKEVLSVMLKLIKSAIQRTIWRNRSERGIILFDEFAKQLKFPNVLESVEFYYQAIRKQNGAIGIILQSINQLPANATAASILENTQVIYSLRNEKGYRELVERLQLSSHDVNQLHSIRNNLTGDRKYTEFFLKIGKESNIFRLEVPPEVYAAYLTDGAEHEQILELYQETGNMEQAIQAFLRERK